VFGFGLRFFDVAGAAVDVETSGCECDAPVIGAALYDNSGEPAFSAFKLAVAALSGVAIE
jgi:hypothetical protein